MSGNIFFSSIFKISRLEYSKFLNDKKRVFLSNENSESNSLVYTLSMMDSAPSLASHKKTYEMNKTSNGT